MNVLELTDEELNYLNKLLDVYEYKYFNNDLDNNFYSTKNKVNDLFDSLQNKDDEEPKNIIVTLREIVYNDDLCDELGINPWCLNEGLGSGDEEYRITKTMARKYGII